MDFDVDAFQDHVSRLDEEHRDGMRTMRADIEELHAETRQAAGGASRRDFLIRSGIAAASLTIGSAVIPMSSLWTPAYGQALTDGDIAEYAASVEYAAVAAYDIAIKSGKVKTAAVGAAATAFQKQHKEHGDAFAGASGKAKPEANGTLVKALGPQFQSAADEKALLELAYSVENAAAATYLFALGALKSAAALKLTASILPIEAGHAAALGVVLGKDPKADAAFLPAYQGLDGALAPDKYPIKAA